MARKNRTGRRVQAPKGGRTRTAGFWHSIAEGLDFCDEVMLQRMCR